MEKIYLSDSGPKVSNAIYGFWRWEESNADDTTKMEQIINLCLEQGINTFDHADIYGGYTCEAAFGQVMRKKSFKREDIVLFTKCGLTIPHPNRPKVRVAHLNTSAAHVTQCAEQSLRNLQTDYIDIFLLDRLDPLSNLEETALALEKLRSSGKVRNIGVANFTVFQHQLLASYLRKVTIVTNHIELNLLNTTALDNGQLDYIKQRYMRALAAAPLAGGRIQNGTDGVAIRVRQKLDEIAKKYDTNIESIAVAWISKLGALPLIGTTNVQRIHNIVNSFNIQLSHEDWYDLYNVSRGKNLLVE